MHNLNVIFAKISKWFGTIFCDCSTGSAWMYLLSGAKGYVRVIIKYSYAWQSNSNDSSELEGYVDELINIDNS